MSADEPEGEITSAHGVEKIETDGKLRAEAGVDGISEQLARMLRKARLIAGISTRTSPKPEQ